MSVVIRKVLPEEVAELKVISEDTFRETFAHDNTEAQLQGYFDTFWIIISSVPLRSPIEMFLPTTKPSIWWNW